MIDSAVGQTRAASHARLRDGVSGFASHAKRAGRTCTSSCETIVLRVHFNCNIIAILFIYREMDFRFFLEEVSVLRVLHEYHGTKWKYCNSLGVEIRAYSAYSRVLQYCNINIGIRRSASSVVAGRSFVRLYVYPPFSEFLLPSFTKALQCLESDNGSNIRIAG